MEITVSVDSRPVHRLIASSPARINRVMYSGLMHGGTLLLGDMREYPPQRPGSTYNRTHNLFNSWSRRRPTGTGLEMSIVVGSDSDVAPYNIQVQHPDFQAAIHVGRWQTTETVQRARQGDIQRFFDIEMRREFANT